MSPNILIIGATGAIGTYITQQIVSAKSSFGRIAILTSRNTVNTKAAELEKLKDAGVEVIVGDLGVEEDVKKAYQGLYMHQTHQTSLLVYYPYHIRNRCRRLSCWERGNRNSDPAVRLSIAFPLT